MQRRYVATALLALCTLLALVITSCGGGSGKASTAFSPSEAAQRGSHAVGVTTIDLVDTSRQTEANGDIPATDGRRLTTEVWYPAEGDASQTEVRDADLASNDTPYPLVIFAHGLGSFRLLSASFARTARPATASTMPSTKTRSA